MRSCLSVVAAIAILVLSTLAAAAQTRHALAIGIDNYENLTDLAKARNDARAVSQTLDGLGFSVTTLLDPGRQEIHRALLDLAERIAPGDEVAFFFAGHGVEVDGRNYLLPADLPAITTPQQQALVTTESVSADHVLDVMRESGARVRIVILDACREVPFAQAGTRSVGGNGGLAQMASAQGEFILFSAGARQVALDHLGDGDADPNSVFTRLLLPRLTEPGLPLHEMARGLREDVQRLALTVGVHQRPTYYDDIDADYALAPAAATLQTGGLDMPPPPPRPGAVGEPRVAETVCDAASEAWLAAIADPRPEAFQAILQEHASCGRYGELATMWLEVLTDAPSSEPDFLAAPETHGDSPLGDTPFATEIAALVIAGAPGITWTEERIAGLPEPVRAAVSAQSPRETLAGMRPTTEDFEQISYEDGGRYEGQLQSGNWHGIGRYHAPDGSVFEGQFAHGSFSGTGFARFADGSTNIGEFYEFTPIGLGIWTGSDGAQYFGQREGVPHGAGHMTYADGSRYVGDWVYDLRHGTGTMTQANGDSYTGEWVEDVRHGYGTYTYGDGRLYQGEWTEGVRHGTGRMTYPDGSSYSGEWRDGLRNGIGTFRGTDGTTYVGEWQGDLRHGRGRITEASGDSYVGDWSSDVRNGTGRFQFADGTVYEGDVLDGMLHGSGTMRSPDGTLYEGDWAFGMRQGNGKMTYPGGDSYDGQWNEGLRHGTGTYTDTSGQSVTGTYISDVLQN